MYDMCEGLEPRATVSSFGGYEGLDEPDSPKPAADSLVLVSYSATGMLADKVISKSDQKDPLSIIAVFSDELKNVDHTSACPLGEDHGIGIISEIQSKSSDPELEECVECTLGFSPIVLSGDQLLPNEPRQGAATVDILPTKAPKRSHRRHGGSCPVRNHSGECSGCARGDPPFTREVFLQPGWTNTAIDA